MFAPSFTFRGDRSRSPGSWPWSVWQLVAHGAGEVSVTGGRGQCSQTSSDPNSCCTNVRCIMLYPRKMVEFSAHGFGWDFPTLAPSFVFVRNVQSQSLRICRHRLQFARIACTQQMFSSHVESRLARIAGVPRRVQSVANPEKDLPDLLLVRRLSKDLQFKPILVVDIPKPVAFATRHCLS